ncbi:MAG TPA: hypothetical protein VG317_10555 [Pseudonocardiaceae bacterium]|nr:hypothetical protein [Pseudonocardiaceae bacterium]
MGLAVVATVAAVGVSSASTRQTGPGPQATPASLITAAAVGNVAPNDGPPPSDYPPDPSGGGCTTKYLHLQYDVTVKTTINNLGEHGENLVINGGLFDACLNLGQPKDNLTGDIILPGARGSFLAFRFMPVSADTTFTSQPVYGTFASGKLNTTIFSTIGLANSTVNGVSLPMGTCQTVTPVKVPIVDGPSPPLGYGLPPVTYTSPVTIPSFGPCMAQGPDSGDQLGLLFTKLISAGGGTVYSTLTYKCTFGNQQHPC